jgi:hypothetical protein
LRPATVVQARQAHARIRQGQFFRRLGSWFLIRRPSRHVELLVERISLEHLERVITVLDHVITRPNVGHPQDIPLSHRKIGHPELKSLEHLPSRSPSARPPPSHSTPSITNAHNYPVANSFCIRICHLPPLLVLNFFLQAEHSYLNMGYFSFQHFCRFLWFVTPEIIVTVLRMTRRKCLYPEVLQEPNILPLLDPSPSS